MIAPGQPQPEEQLFPAATHRKSEGPFWKHSNEQIPVHPPAAVVVLVVLVDVVDVVEVLLVVVELVEVVEVVDVVDVELVLVVDVLVVEVVEVLVVLVVVVVVQGVVVRHPITGGHGCDGENDGEAHDPQPVPQPDKLDQPESPT